MGMDSKRKYLKKRKKFYQMIIIDTASAKIYREVDKKDRSKTIYSKLKINRVLSYKDWNQSPLTENRFSRVFDPLLIIILIIKMPGIVSCVMRILSIPGTSVSRIL